MVPVDNQCVAMQDGRTTLAVPMLGVHLAQVFFPDQLSIQVEAIQAVRSEGSEDTLAVGDGGGRGEAAADMAGFERSGFEHRLLPENLAGGAADRQDHEIV